MSKAIATTRETVLEWFETLPFEKKCTVAQEITAIVDREKASRIRDLESELARLRTEGGGPKKVPKIAAKYVDPRNKTNVWSGRGMQPGWVRDYLKKGGSLDDLKVKGT